MHRTPCDSVGCEVQWNPPWTGKCHKNFHAIYKNGRGLGMGRPKTLNSVSVVSAPSGAANAICLFFSFPNGKGPSQSLSRLFTLGAFP
jgi:hypothetical protein